MAAANGIRYPVRSKCWVCGRFVEASPAWARRECHRCDVVWYQRLPGQPLNSVVDWRTVERNMAHRWPWHPDADFADQFDGLVDHGAVNIPCPA